MPEFPINRRDVSACCRCLLSGAICPEFQCHIMPLPKFDPNLACYGGPRGGDRKWYQSKCRPRILNSTCIHTLGLSCTASNGFGSNFRGAAFCCPTNAFLVHVAFSHFVWIRRGRGFYEKPYPLISLRIILIKQHMLEILTVATEFRYSCLVRFFKRIRVQRNISM